MIPNGIQIGPLNIHFYGVIIMIGAVLAAWLTSRQAKAAGQNTDTIWDMLPWLLIGEIIGARIWHILTPPNSNVAQGLTTAYYFSHPLDMLMIWNGGLGIPGAVIGGVVALYVYTKKHQLVFGQWVDFIAPGLAMAQAIGRWGNFVNQELYGAPTTLPWKIFIDQAHRIPGYQDVAYYHPLFLYESIYNFIIMGILIFVGRKYKDWLKTGDIFLMYLILYPLGRFLLEFLRLDPSSLGSFNANQTIMGIIAICATISFILRHKKPLTPTQETE